MKIGLPTTEGNRAIVGVDVEGSTNLTDPEKATLRKELYHLLGLSLWRSGLMPRCDALVDRGDGALILLRTSAQSVLDTFIPSLGQFLASYNARNPTTRYRLRVAVHVGHVHFDQRAPFGEAVDRACRLLDAPELKLCLKRTTASFVLAVSDSVHRSIAEHGEIARRSFRLLGWLRIGGEWQEVWAWVPPQEGFSAAS
jgi:hypothetical protein